MVLMYVSSRELSCERVYVLVRVSMGGNVSKRKCIYVLVVVNV